MRALIFLVVALLAGAASADSTQEAIDRYGAGASGRIEVVPALPRPVPEPMVGVKPKVTVGTSENYLPDEKRAVYDPVSPQSREHLETMIQELRKR